MLETLHVRDIALIEEASLELGPGLTVLTGETGAGKTALLSALKLLVGERADASVVRDGATETCVEAVFGVTVPAASGEDATGCGLDEEGDEGTGAEPQADASGKGEGMAPKTPHVAHGGEQGSAGSPIAEQELIVRRRLSSDGRSRCFLDGELATVGTLAERVGPLVDLHGQHEHQSLLSTTSQLRYLDAWIGAEAHTARAAYTAAFEAAAQARRLHEQVVAAARASAQSLDAARFVCQEMERVRPIPGEYEQLEAELPRLRHGAALAEAAAEAFASLREDGGGVDALATAQAAFEREASIDAQLDALGERCATLAALVEDLAQDIRLYRDSVDFDPEALEEALARLGELGGLCKRYGPQMEDVLARWDEAQRTLELADSSDDRLAATEEAAREAGAQLVSRAHDLETVRTSSIERFTAALGDSVAALAMGGSAFNIEVTPLDRSAWTTEGSARYEILYRPAPNITFRPLARIASGGELSRVMLALKCLLNADGGRTLVFDEVDAGIGGATAGALASRLVELSCSQQVIVVTHLAQIAAAADHHFVVEKVLGDEGVSTSIHEVKGEGRVTEVARMLSGTADEVALEHARALLDEQGSRRDAS